MALKNQDFSLFSGNSSFITITINDIDGNPVDLTGASSKWSLFQSSLLKLEKTPDIPNPGTGNVEISLESLDTKDFKPGNYYHELQITDSNGNVYTACYGIVNIRKSYI